MIPRQTGTRTAVCYCRNVYSMILLCLLLCVNCVSLVEGKKKEGGESTNQTEAIERLSRVFGIESVPVHVFRKSPPQFMMELFNDITDSGGLIKKQGPYNANTVVSYPDKAVNSQMHFYYNVTYIHPAEKMLEAEFHVFRMSTSRNTTTITKRSVRHSHLIEIKVYQVLDPANVQSPSGKRLLDLQRVSVHVRGWLIFNVTRAVNAWQNDSASNYGLLVSTSTVYGQDLGDTAVRFAQRREHHESKQPILVVYTADDRKRSPNYISPEDEEYKQIKKDIERRERKLERRRRKKYRYDDNRDPTMQTAIRLLNEKDREEYGHPFFRNAKNTNSGVKRRKRNADSVLQSSSESPRKKRNKSGKTKRRKKDKDKRDIDYRYRRHRRTCSRMQMYVDFDEIGWAGWIISPKGYNAYHCKGECPFPLGQSQKPTNHATVQSIVHALRVGKDVSTPCCVPNKLYSISLLYFDDNENVILKQYDDMVAASCGCH